MIPWTAPEGLDPTVPDPTPVVRRQVYPAEVTFTRPGEVGERKAFKVVAYITDEQVWVWHESGGRIELLLRAEYEPDTAEVPPLPVMLHQPARLATASGLVVVRKQAGCGCGATLNRFVPWDPIRHGS